MPSCGTARPANVLDWPRHLLSNDSLSASAAARIEAISRSRRSFSKAAEKGSRKASTRAPSADVKAVRGRAIKTNTPDGSCDGPSGAASTSPLTPGTGSNNQVSCAGATFIYGAYFDSRYSHLMPPNGPSGVIAGGSDPFTAVNNGAQATAAFSHHPGGVNLVLADGSVRFIKNDVDIQTWWALGSIAGGELIFDEQ